MKNDPWNGKNPEDDPIFQSKIQAYRLAEYGPTALKAPLQCGAIDRSIRVVPIQLSFDMDVAPERWLLSEIPSKSSQRQGMHTGPTAGQLYIDSDGFYDPVARARIKSMLEFKRRTRWTDPS